MTTFGMVVKDSLDSDALGSQAINHDVRMPARTINVIEDRLGVRRITIHTVIVRVPARDDY